MPTVLAFWLEDELLPELFSNTSPPLPLEEPVPLLSDPPEEPVEVDPPAPSPTVMPMAELICCEMLYKSSLGLW